MLHWSQKTAELLVQRCPCQTPLPSQSWTGFPGVGQDTERKENPRKNMIRNKTIILTVRFFFPLWNKDERNLKWFLILSQPVKERQYSNACVAFKIFSWWIIYIRSNQLYLVEIKVLLRSDSARLFSCPQHRPKGPSWTQTWRTSSTKQRIKTFLTTLNKCREFIDNI